MIEEMRNNDGVSLKHVLDIDSFTRSDIELVLENTSAMEEVLNRDIKKVPALRGKTIVTLFYEPSTRTRVSFEQAGKILSADVINVTDSTSSSRKGESLYNTVLTIQAMKADIIVIRHHHSGAPHFLARNLKSHVINAGDGTEHPTQALVDLFTIQEALGSVEKKHITLVGDMDARTARSLLYALSPYPSTTTSIVSAEGRPGSLLEAAMDSDALYVLRPQQENWSKDIKDPARRAQRIEKALEKYYAACTVNSQVLAHMPENSIVLHPRPRGPELPTEVDSDPRVLHAVQGRNGGPVRIALLEMMHSGEWQRLAKQ